MRWYEVTHDERVITNTFLISSRGSSHASLRPPLLLPVFIMSIDTEKKHESYEEDAAIVSVNGKYEAAHLEVRQTAERRLLRKLDFRLLPTIVVIYLMNYVDVRPAGDIMYAQSLICT